MDPVLFDFLKKISFISNSGIIISSTKELAEKTELSQQSVSRYLIMLEEQGYIARKRIKNGEEIVLKEKTFQEFNREKNELEFILNNDRAIEVEGNVFSGMGEGSYYMSRNKYIEGVVKFLGFRPYPGTLNIRINEEFSFLSAIIPSINGYRVESFEEGGRKFGGIKLLRAEFNGEKCGIVIPERTHYNGVLEIISENKLRERYSIKDNDKIKVKIFK
ncbi:MAG: DUF120 domain-containing protein [Thermoplasmata archaeon]